ncbi:unnamed protein product [Cuscuta campestris]|uniref:RING-type domain-containing protein n=1 Tax=Cuscuta campestris TaxID=132261 RepID=A0A484LZ55_9ASTE|nr:unnamed protein product [Cuscuta campestris]
MDGPPENDICSICHGTFHIPCQANCSHWFCGKCILQVWDHGPAFQPCKCPLCRRQITLLVPSDNLSRQRRAPDDSDVFTKIQRYNGLFGRQTNGLSQKLQDLPFLLRRLLRDITDPQRSLPFFIRARVYLAVKSSMHITVLCIFNFGGGDPTWAVRSSMHNEFILDIC